MERIWVKDSVLERFEDTGSGYEVMPESGAVSGPGGGWGYCQRVDRNHIRMELKKLYGSAPPWMIRHVHDHAVQPPTPGVTDEPNIATRTQALFEAMKELDRALRSLSRALGVDSSDPGPTGWAYEDLDHRGWWKDETWARLSHHVPEDLDLDQFLERCNRLWQIFDRASESDLRAILRECGGVPDSDWQSLKLLEEIVRRCRTAQDTGLELTADSEAIVSRLEGEREQLAVMAPPFRTNEIRQASAHTRSDREAKVREELAALDLDLNSYGSNLGFCYDDLMDKFTAAIQQIAASIRRAPV